MAQQVLKATVSIIMPAFNASEFISEAIESILSQTFTEWELIVVNDGSTDPTEKIVKGYQERDKRVRYFYQPNGRQGKARNRGIRMATGKYLAFLDADDIWTKDKLEIQIQQLESENVDLVFSDFGLINENGEVTSSSIGVEGGVRFGIKELILFFEQNRIPILTALAKKSSVESSGFFSEEPLIQNAEDYHLWLKMLLQNCQFRSFSNVFAYYRLHSQQNTKTDNLATASVLNALLALDITDYLQAVQRRNAVYRWLIRYYQIHSRRSDRIEPVFCFLSKNSVQFKLIKNILPFVNQRWEKRLVSRFCHYKLSHG
ncbi:MAG: glycosyltransferase family 2 protein [Flavobacterium sp.]|nr:MAG: glycosyltransferase family 2 protein [Flavobacterium sp.]